MTSAHRYYEGEWAFDMRNGSGKEVFHSKNALMCSAHSGINLLSDGDCYEGEFVEGRFEGEGFY